LVPKEPTFEMIKAGVQHELMGDMAGRYKAMLSASPTPPEVIAWQPIETAPKDGTEVLLGRLAVDSDDWDASTLGWWIEAEEDGPDSMGHNAGFVDYAFSTFHPSRDFGSESHRYEALKPTHWMPLPPPPDDRTNASVEQSESLKQTPSLSPPAPREVTLLKEALEEIDAELDKQVYGLPPRSDPIPYALRDADQDIPPDYQHDVIITEALWDKIRAALSSTASGGENNGK
jgi:hypothetical protein